MPESRPRLTRAERIERWLRTLFAGGEPPPGWSRLTAGDLAVAFEQAHSGIALRSLYDLRLGRELLTPVGAPLFTIVLYDGAREMTVEAGQGWAQTGLQRIRGGFVLDWIDPLDERIGRLHVRLRADADAAHHALRWKLSAMNNGAPCSIRRVVFPQIALRRFDDSAVVLFPSGPGEIKRGAWEADWRYDQPYGQAWCTMQFMAAYAETGAPAGLYVGAHDPFAGSKELRARSDAVARTVTLSFDTPAPEMLRPGNGFRLSGESVWQLLRGDWYDAAMIYKAWAQEHARWWPRLGREGREDTPLWARELGAWVQAGFEPGTNTGMAPEASVAPVKRFRDLVDVPVAVHWYAWHEIPFDNDYPHYFPAKAGFAGAVQELHQAGVYSMPYINGRLWDTRDRGSEDYEFTRVALPAASKDENGKPIIERYGSREADGSPVELAVMCPTTELWQERVREIALRLINEIGADSVYIDQVAAAKPVLCCDESHGHPLGGGHWWNEGYWDLVDRIRQALPPGRMLTTECNAEAFLRQFDACLTWHWQHDNMVPVFPAVYGGTIQTFGRSYSGDALAQRMKAGQQFVFGEQIGWFNAEIIDQPGMGKYLRQLIRLRWRLRRYFYAGEMCRPPRLRGDMPVVQSDWQWYGECWVTTDAVLTGAWALRGEPKLALLFVNVSDAPVTALLAFDGRSYGIPAGEIRLTAHGEFGAASAPQIVGSRFQRAITFPPCTAIAWELAWLNT